MMIARQAHKALDPLHTMIYFASEAKERFAALGLDKSRLAYCAGRAAAMGAVGPGVVAAAFYNFNPAAIAKVIPKAWSISSPESITAARFEAADAALLRMLGEAVVNSDTVSEAAELAEEATKGCTPEARPLYAGHADQEWPQAPHLRLWHAASLLREYRGDGHLWALRRAELSGLQAVVLRTNSSGGQMKEFMKSSRGWSETDWAAGEEALRERGLLDAAGAATEAATALLEELEVETDTLAAAPWAYLGTERTERLIEQGSELAKTLVRAGAFPESIMAARR